MNSLLAFLQQQNSTDGTFHVSYHVFGAGTWITNEMYYPVLTPDIVDQWGNLVYYRGAGIYLAAHEKNGNQYTFKISTNYRGAGTDYYQWTGTCPQDVNDPIILSGGSAPFPTIQ